MKTRLSIHTYQEGIRSGDRVLLAKAITLVESVRPDDQEISTALIDAVLPDTGRSIRVGITGVPGVGKSTFIERFGLHIIAQGKKVAVLTVDPSSQRTQGSILGDKTRMDELSKNPNAFIRPSASGSTLGGVAGSTREAILLCEAAGFDYILVETVGVGQSEVAVRNMVDFFLLLLLAGAGDELQGIKKGIMEMADAVAITKAEKDNLQKATQAQADVKHALHLFQASPSGWIPPVVTCSALTDTGVVDIIKLIDQYVQQTTHSGYFEKIRNDQNISWLHERFQQLIQRELQRHGYMKEVMQDVEKRVEMRELSPVHGSKILLQEFLKAARTLS